MDAARSQRFRDLKVWRDAVELAKMVYRVTSEMPASERYGLVSQMRRAAVSVPSNIAEGSVRHSRRQFAHYLEIALGSLAELETQLEIARELRLLNDISEVEDCTTHVRRLLYGLHAAMSPRR